jgi:hypothetical protein
MIPFVGMLVIWGLEAGIDPEGALENLLTPCNTKV